MKDAIVKKPKKQALYNYERRAIKKRNRLLIKLLISTIFFAIITRALLSDATDSAEILFSYTLWAFFTLAIFLGDI